MPTLRLRRSLAAVLAVGLLGTLMELLLLGHYDGAWQLVPLVLVLAALAAVGWDVIRPGRASARVLRTTMILFMFASAGGVALHFRGAAEFQRDIDPTISGWNLIKKVARAKAPPLLAPGVMLQLGLLGLAYAQTAAATEP
jgi:hypothetical protein